MFHVAYQGEYSFTLLIYYISNFWVELAVIADIQNLAQLLFLPHSSNYRSAQFEKLAVVNAPVFVT
jgi:hypothetical protein